MSNTRLKNNLSKMRNQSVSGDRSPIKKHQSHHGEAWSVGCKFSKPEDTNQIKHFIQSELDFYNQIVNTFNPTARTSPEVFAAFSEKHINLFGLLAEYGIKIQLLYQNSLPGEFKQFEDILKDGSINERMKILMESVSGRFSSIRSVKRAMAREILKFYIQDSKIRSQRTNSELQEYKTPPRSLQVHTSIAKRHIQIPRSEVDVRFDDALFKSFVKIPYLKSPIMVNQVDLTEKKSWSIVILHQSPNFIPLSSTPWVLDFRGTKADYLIDYVDNANDKSGVFWQAKVGRSGR